MNKADVSHRRNGFCLSNNPNLPWSLEFIDKHEDRLDTMTSNEGIWKKVLEPILDDQKVSDIIKEAKKTNAEHNITMLEYHLRIQNMF